MYRGHSVGRVISFIKAICGLHVSQEVIVEDGQITLRGQPFATYEWKENGGYSWPVFTFHFTVRQEFINRQDDLLSPRNGLDCFYRDDLYKELSSKLEEYKKLLREISSGVDNCDTRYLQNK